MIPADRLLPGEDMSLEEGGAVAIGGLGGSGTRVVARMLQLSGCHIGPRLNSALDNLWFTLLFKRLDWSLRAPRPDELGQAVELFRRAMTTGIAGAPDPAEAALLAQLEGELPPNGSWKSGVSASEVGLIAQGSGTGGGRWGWKEPNTHVFLPALAQHLPGLRYIHVVRDGFDMAFSHNLQQARNWAHLYGLPVCAEADPAQQLRFWTVANGVALERGPTVLPGRFLVVSYEALCAEPARAWRRMLRFQGLPDDRPLPDEFELRPRSIGRAGEQDLSCLPREDVLAAQALAERVAELDRVLS